MPAGVWSDRPRRCMNCEESIPSGSRFCAECGVAPVHDARFSPGLKVLLGTVALTFLVIAIAFVDRRLPGHHPAYLGAKLGDRPADNPRRSNRPALLLSGTSAASG